MQLEPEEQTDEQLARVLENFARSAESGGFRLVEQDGETFREAARRLRREEGGDDG